MNSKKWADRAAPYLQPVTEGPGDAWSREAAKMGRTGSQQLLFAGEVAAPQRVAVALGVTPGDPIVLRSRLILLDGEPVEQAHSYYPSTVAAGTPLSEPRKIRGGAVNLLAELGFVAHAANEEVMSRPASLLESETLELPASDWVLDVFRVVKASDGRPFEATSMIMRARGRTLTYTTEIG
jgi:DNA-binding GntR family transcriptional regulator